jgi:transcriptional regulator with XRE-family HTH domain
MRAKNMMLTINRQLRAARALIGWEQKDLAAAADISVGTVRRMEQLDGLIRAQHETVLKIQRAFENAGIEFLNHGSPGVRLRSHAAEEWLRKNDYLPQPADAGKAKEDAASIGNGVILDPPPPSSDGASPEDRSANPPEQVW